MGEHPFLTIVIVALICECITSVVHDWRKTKELEHEDKLLNANPKSINLEKQE